MISLAEWKDLVFADERELSIGGSIIFGSGTEIALTGSEIASVTIDEGSDGALTCGAVLSAVCRADLVNDEGQWNPGGSLLGNQMLIGATLVLRLGASDGENTLWQDLGVFQIENAVYAESEAVLRVSCADSIAFELGEAYADDLAYPASLDQIWRSAIARTRYLWEGSVPNGAAIVDAKPDWQGASLRSVLGMIAAAAGCFVHVDRSGSLQLVKLVSERNYALDPDSYLRLERDDAFYGPVDTLRLVPVGEEASERFYYADSDQTALHVLSVENNPLFQQGAPNLDALAQGMLSQMAGYASEKAEFTWRGDPMLHIGDKITLSDLGGRGFTGVLSRQTLSYKQSFSASCACMIPDQTDSGMRRAITPEGGLNAAALTGAVNGELLSVGSVTTNKLAAGAITAEKIAAGAVDAAALNAVTAKIASLTASDISTDRLAAALAAFTVITAGSADFNRATVEHLVANLFNLTGSAVMEDVFIHNLKIAYAQLVSASIGNLVLQSSDGEYYRIDVNQGGEVTASRVYPSNAEIEEGVFGETRPIIATQMTVDDMNATTIKAVSLLVNKIDAARIDTDELFANKAFVDHLMTTDISSNSYIQQSIVNTATGEVEKYVRLDGSGIAVGKENGTEQLFIDETGVSTRVNGQQYSKFGDKFVQFGNYQLRRSADGGLVFKLTEG